MHPGSTCEHRPPPIQPHAHATRSIIPGTAGAKAPGGPENLLVATHTRNMLVYRGSTLVWAARADTQPVAITIADIGSMRGMIVTLDDTGKLVVSYLGTDPMLTPVGFIEVRAWGVQGACEGGRHTDAYMIHQYMMHHTSP